MHRLLVLAAIALVTSSCTIRPTGDGGIAVVPVQDSPISIKALVTSEAAPNDQPEQPTPEKAEGCSPASTTYPEWLAATIKGEQVGSRVNVRPAPSLAATSGSYGLVGEPVDVIGEAIAEDCDRWYHVNFPSSGYRGYVRSDFVAIKE